MYDILVYEIVFQAFAHDRAKENNSAETLGKPAWTRVSLVDIYSSSVAPSCMGTEPARTQGQRPYVNPIHFTETVATALSCLVSVQRPNGSKRKRRSRLLLWSLSRSLSRSLYGLCTETQWVKAVTTARAKSKVLQMVSDMVSVRCPRQGGVTLDDCMSTREALVQAMLPSASALC